MNAQYTFTSRSLAHAGSRHARCTKPTGLDHFTRSIDRAMLFLGALVLALVHVIFASSDAALADGRVALLLGGEKYQNFRASKLTTEHLIELETLLKQQGFTVLVASNAGNADARVALQDFSHKAEGADFALIVTAGHFATYQRQSFFLPVNARVRRATDLFSRGLSVSSIADIARKAKAGAVLMLVTVPDIPSTVAGISMRPNIANAPPPHIVAIFSSSDKVPVSRVDSISVQAIKDLIDVARENPLMLSALVDSASAGATGRRFGELKEFNLSLDQRIPPPPESDETARANALTNAERKARIDAEARLSEAEARAREAEQRAINTVNRAKRELAAAAATRQPNDAKAADNEPTADMKTKIATAAPPATPALAVSTAPVEGAAMADLQSLQVVEALLGREQRKVIQRLLKEQGLYDGSIDAIFGDLTRVAIRAFQKKSGAPETGYLTPAQFQKLIANK